MKSSFLGIDIAKETFYIALNSRSGDKPLCREFANKPTGFDKLLTWLQGKEVNNLHACMEATGHYGEKLATFLYEQGFQVSVVNPAQIKAFAGSELLRTKTDKVDAALIMRYTQAMSPKLWQPAPAHIRELRALHKRRDDIQHMMQQEKNRRDGASASVCRSIDAAIGFYTLQLEEIEEKLKQHIDSDPELKHKKELIESIPGLGEHSVPVILSVMAPDRDFKQAREVSAFMGLNPQARESGTSVRGRGHISKKGDSRLRKALYMPAIVAMKHNPIIKAFCERLKKNGKSGKVVVVAAMKKLVHIIFGVLKNNQPFNPNWSHA